MYNKGMFHAAVLEAINKPLAIYQLEIPGYLFVGQLQVKIHYSGICGKQLAEISGLHGPDKFLPHTLGHEGSVEILAVGPGVRTLRIGDRAVAHWRKGTGIDALPPKYWCPSLKKEIGGGQVNTFQEYAIISENRLTKIPKGIPMDVAALFGCAVTTGLGVCTNDLHVKLGQSAVVAGCGGVGLNILQGLMLMSAYPIIGIDIDEVKLQQALVFGATHVINVAGKMPEDILTEIHKIAGSAGVDNAVDTTGKSQIIEIIWEAARFDGKVCLVGQIAYNQRLALQTIPMHQGRLLIGSDGGRTNPTEDIPRYIKLLNAGRLNLSGLITHRTRLSNINAMLDTIKTGKVGRSIIDMC